MNNEVKEIDNVKKVHEVELVDVVEMNQEHPTTFIIPSKEDIAKLEKGNTIKLGFFTDNVECSVERMWVLITMIREDGSFIGKLDNDQYQYRIKNLVYEDYVKFETKNILSIYEV